MLCLCGVGKLIIVWVLCRINLYELFQFCTLFFLCCFWETKAFLERHTLCPRIQENAQNLGQIADEDRLRRGRSLSRVIHLYLFHELALLLLAAQLKSSAHRRVVRSPSGHLSNCCSSWQPCLRSSGLGLFVPLFFWWKAFFLDDSTSRKIEKPCQDQN